MPPDLLSPATEALLERPLPARSLVASLLLRTRPARMRGSRLVQWCGLFGIAEGTTRTALSRMVERGELLTQDGVYELAGRVQGRRHAQDWSLEPVLGSWNGEWRVALVAAGSRPPAARAALREAMRRMRFGSWREGVWARPDNLPRESAPEESWIVAETHCAWWTGRPDDDPTALAAALFGAPQWTARAGLLTARLADLTGALATRNDASLADAFVGGAAALAHIRADPMLPSELATEPAAGDELRSSYRTYEDAFSASLRAWFRGR